MVTGSPETSRSGDGIRVLGGWRVRAGLVAGLVALALALAAPTVPGLVEIVYARGLYPPLVTGLASVSGLVTPSLIDPLIVLLAALVVRAAWRAHRALRPRGRLVAAAGVCVRVASAAGAVWLVFLLAWGLNYARPHPARLLRLGPPQPDRFEPLIREIGRRLDRLRAELPEDADGVVLIPPDLGAWDRHVAPLEAETFASLGLPAIRAGRAKWLLSSPLSRRWSVSGFYGPLTGEPTVVWPPAPASLPFVVAHERAHLHGIATEDGASLFALLTLWRSPRPTARYAAWLSLWTSLRLPVEGRHPGVRRDLVAIRRHVERWRGVEWRLAWRIYDRWLRTQGIREGARSYAGAAPLALQYLIDRGLPEPIASAGGEFLGDGGEQLAPVGRLGERPARAEPPGHGKEVEQARPAAPRDGDDPDVR
ncbi:MAG: hypothetical protein Kow0062_17990 [Acidobacteriota bacterium]